MFFERLQSLCSQDVVKDVSGVLKALGLSTSKGTAWRGGAIPKGDILLKLANYFHVSTDYLLGNTDDPRPAGQKETPSQEGGQEIGFDSFLYAMKQETKDLPQEKKDMLLNMARFMKQEEEKRKQQ